MVEVTGDWRRLQKEELSELYYLLSIIKKLKQSRNMPGVAHRVTGGLGSQIFMIFRT